jgi:hypothetical protein
MDLAREKGGRLEGLVAVLDLEMNKEPMKLWFFEDSDYISLLYILVNLILAPIPSATVGALNQSRAISNYS